MSDKKWVSLNLDDEEIRSAYTIKGLSSISVALRVYTEDGTMIDFSHNDIEKVVNSIGFAMEKIK